MLLCIFETLLILPFLILFKLYFLYNFSNIYYLLLPTCHFPQNLGKACSSFRNPYSHSWHSHVIETCPMYRKWDISTICGVFLPLCFDSVHVQQQKQFGFCYSRGGYRKRTVKGRFKGHVHVSSLIFLLEASIVAVLNLVVWVQFRTRVCFSISELFFQCWKTVFPVSD